MSTTNLPAIRACRPAWNKGRIVGQKRPLQPKHVWAIRVRLEIAHRTRELALFNLAIDRKLRGCDLVRRKVADVYAAGQVKHRAAIVQSKTSRPVSFEITEGTRKAIEASLGSPLMVGSEHLWPGRFHERLHISTRQDARLVRDLWKSTGLTRTVRTRSEGAAPHMSVWARDDVAASSLIALRRHRAGYGGAARAVFVLPSERLLPAFLGGWKQTTAKVRKPPFASAPSVTPRLARSRGGAALCRSLYATGKSG